MSPHFQVSLFLLGCLPSLVAAQIASPRSRVSATTGATLVPPPAAPQGLRQTGALPTVIHLSWDSVLGATGYRILRSASEGGPWLDRTPAGSPGNFLNDGDLLPSHSMWYRVSALYPDGSSGMSVAVKMATAAASPLLNVVATWEKPNPRLIECYARLSWSRDPLANGYYVFRDNKIVTPRPVPASTATHLDSLPPLSGAYEYFVVQLFEAKDFPAQGQTSLAEGDLEKAQRVKLEVPDQCIIG